MKTTHVWALGTVLALSCSTGMGQTIYSEDFSGAATTINGLAPTEAYDFAGGSASALWYNAGSDSPDAVLADGTLNAARNTIQLPFTPEAGYVYRLTASFTSDANIGNWIGLGFSELSPNPPGDGRLSSSTLHGMPWMAGFDGAVRVYAENGTGGFYFPSGSTVVGTHTYEIELDTTAPTWQFTFAYDGVVGVTSFSSYDPNPPIHYVGLTQNNSPSGAGLGTWNSFKLETLVPEPSSIALVGLGMGALVLIRRKRARA